MIAALVLGGIAVVGVLAVFLQRRARNKLPLQPPVFGPATAFNNQMYDTGAGDADGTVGADGTGGSGRGRLPSGAFVASTLDMRMQRQQIERSNPNFQSYSSPNIPTAQELEARAAAAGDGGYDVVGSGTMHTPNSSSITYATVAAEPSDAYDGVAYSSVMSRMEGDDDAAGVQYRPIYDMNGAGGTGGGSNATYNTIGRNDAAAAAMATYAQPLSKDVRPAAAPQAAPTLPVRRSTVWAKCERPSPKGGTCKTPQIDGSLFCATHTCPAVGCTAGKSSSEEVCPHHAARSSGSGSGGGGGGGGSGGGGDSGGGGGGGGVGISRKGREGSTYDGFGGDTVDPYGTSVESSRKGVARGQQSVYAGFDSNVEEEV